MDQWDCSLSRTRATTSKHDEQSGLVAKHLFWIFLWIFLCEVNFRFLMILWLIKLCNVILHCTDTCIFLCLACMFGSKLGLIWFEIGGTFLAPQMSLQPQKWKFFVLVGVSKNGLFVSQLQVVGEIWRDEFYPFLGFFANFLPKNWLLCWKWNYDVTS